MKIEKKEKFLSVLNQIIGIFLVIVIFTFPFPKYKQTIETICFFIIILAFIAKWALSKIKDIDKHGNKTQRVSLNGITGTRIDLPILIFTIFIIISIFFSVDYRHSLHAFKGYWLIPILLFYIIVNFAVNKKIITYIIWAVILSSLAPIILGLFEYFTGAIRIKSLFGAPTEFGQYLDYILPLMFAMVLWSEAKISKILLSFIFVGALFCLVFTYTRASWISVLIAMFLLCFIKNKKVILIPIVLVSLLLIFSSHGVKDRVISMTDKEHYLNRIYLFESAIDQIKKKPLTGYGWGYKNFYKLYPSFISPELKSIGWTQMYHAHNYPLQIAFETGILGLIVFLWMWITIIILTWKNFTRLNEPFLKSIAIGIFAVFIACSIHWLVEIPDAKQLIMMLWTFIGITMAIVNITEGKWEKKNL